MQDFIIQGNGNSRFLKSVSDFKERYPTYDDFVTALVAGTLPVDLYGINADGVRQMGTPLNKANLLTDDTSSLLGLNGGTSTVNTALSAMARIVADNTQQTGDMQSEIAGLKSAVTAAGDLYGTCSSAPGVSQKRIYVPGLDLQSLVDGTKITIFFSYASDPYTMTDQGKGGWKGDSIGYSVAKEFFLNDTYTAHPVVSYYHIRSGMAIGDNQYDCPTWKAGEIKQFVYHTTNQGGAWVMISPPANTAHIIEGTYLGSGVSQSAVVFNCNMIVRFGVIYGEGSASSGARRILVFLLSGTSAIEFVWSSDSDTDPVFVVPGIQHEDDKVQLLPNYQNCYLNTRDWAYQYFFIGTTFN